MKRLMTAALLCLVATPAFAHSAVNATTPENGAVVTEAPPHIVLTFANRFLLTRVQITYDDHSAVDLDLGEQKAFATRFVVPLTDMGRGLYRVEWRGLAGDGHAMRDAFTSRSSDPFPIPGNWLRSSRGSWFISGFSEALDWSWPASSSAARPTASTSR